MQVKSMDQTHPHGQSHVLMFPFPAQSHVNAMLKLAELLCLAGLDVTFLNSDYNQSRLLRFSDVQARFAGYPSFRFETITDGLPEDHPRCGYTVREMFHSTKAVTRPAFREMLASGRLRSVSGLPVTCIIADGLLNFVAEFAKEIGVPCFLLRTISAACFLAYFCIPKLIDAGELPFEETEMDELVTSIPGMEQFLRRRDLPGFFRSTDVTETTLQFVASECRQNSRANALIFNTFEELEPTILSHIRDHVHSCPKVYAIGPLHVHLKSRLAEAEYTEPVSSNNGLWREDRRCMSWLDHQPAKSVVYVSFGSIVVMSRDQVVEFWYGLVNSGKRFLWVMRPNGVTGNEGTDWIPTDLAEATKERGYLVEWAPQEEVLAHEAIGGFMTHSGWNSTLEAVVAGVPMICWPYYADQMLNSRFVGQVWRNGLDMKDTCDRATVERMVRDLMDERRDQFRGCAEKMARLASISLADGGSSHRQLKSLIQDIKNARVLPHVHPGD